jgi:nucleoside phosphorylase
MGRKGIVTIKRSAIIVTALPVEYKAIRAHLTGIQEETLAKGTIYERGDFQGTDCTWDVAIMEVGQGNSTAAVEAERAIQHFTPSVVLLVGVAGGIKDVALGDVVAATKVYGYESGKDGVTFKPRTDVGHSTYRLEQRAKAEAKRDVWLLRLTCRRSPQPFVFVGPIASGEKIVAATTSRTYAFLRSSFSDALAVEMEGYGFLKAVQINPGIEALVVRGISDLVNGKSEADASGWQRIASENASAFAFEVLATWQPPSESPEKTGANLEQRAHVACAASTEELSTQYGGVLVNLRPTYIPDIRPLLSDGSFRGPIVFDGQIEYRDTGRGTNGSREFSAVQPIEKAPRNPALETLSVTAWPRCLEIDTNYHERLNRLLSSISGDNYEEAIKQYWELLYYTGTRELWVHRNFLSNRLLELSRRNRDYRTSGLILAKGQAWPLIYNGSFRDARKLLQKALESFVRAKARSEIAVFHEYMGDICSDTGNVQEANQFYIEARGMLQDDEAHAVELKRLFANVRRDDLASRSRIVSLVRLQDGFSSIKSYKEGIVQIELAKSYHFLTASEALITAEKAYSLLKNEVKMPSSADKAKALLKVILKARGGH